MTTPSVEQIRKEATRRWKVCERDYEATCQKTEEDPRHWCHACVARAMLEFLMTKDEAVASVPQEKNPRASEAARRRWERTREEAGRTQGQWQVEVDDHGHVTSLRHLHDDNEPSRGAPYPNSSKAGTL